MSPMLCGTVQGELPRDADAIVEVTLETGRRLHVPRGLLSARPDGSYELRVSPGIADQPDGSQQVVVPVAREELHVDKRPVITGRTVVHIVPTSRTEVVEVPLTREHIQVERVPINRAVDHPSPVREEGDVTIVPVYEEVLVVEKRLMLKEEIRLTRRRTTETERKEVTVRSEEVHISEVEPNRENVR